MKNACVQKPGAATEKGTGEHTNEKDSRGEHKGNMERKRPKESRREQTRAGGKESRNRNVQFLSLERGAKAWE